MIDDSFLEDFFDETREHLEEMEGCLLELPADPKNSELLNTVFRAVHTIKGASDYLGLENMARLSHRLETLLDAFREGALVADKVAVDILIDGRDLIGEMVNQIESSGEENLEIESLLSRIETFASGVNQKENDEAGTEGEETDRELLDIFMEQLKVGLEELLKTAGRIARREKMDEAAKEMVEQLERLASTANYMGFDALSTIYDDLQIAIEAFIADSASINDESIDAFINDAIIDGLVRIQGIFPQSAVNDIDPLPILNPTHAALLEEDDDGMLLLLDDEEDGEYEANDSDEKSDLYLDMEDDLAFDSGADDGPVEVEPGPDRSLLNDFVDETREHLEELETCLLRLETEPDDQELLNTIFRSMHTIKGSSEYMGLERIARLSHRLETLLDAFRQGSLPADKRAVELLVSARDLIGSLVSEVESTGRESSAIDDFLQRIESLETGSASSGGDMGETITAIEGEADAELFAIFQEQLTSELEGLLKTAGCIARREGLDNAIEMIADQIERLSGTANYMGYDELSAVYDDLQASIGAFASQSSTADDDEIDAFLKTSIISGISRIQKLFPKSEALAAVDILGLVRDTGEKAPIELVIDEESQPASDVDPILAKLPTIGDGERQNLLANSLNETFESMMAIDQEEADASSIGDPLAQQFSSLDEERTAETFLQGADADTEQTLSIFDDYSSTQEILSPELENVASPDGQDTSETEGEEEMEFWPEASVAFSQAADIEISETEPSAPIIDFSSTLSDEKENKEVLEDKKEEPAEANFRSTARKSIRVDAEKIDDLMNQVGELVVTRSSFFQLFFEMREVARHFSQRFPMDKVDKHLLSGLINRLNDATSALGKVASELQEQVMKVRMLPISQLFNRYPRLVHDLVKSGEKKVQLRFHGEETELDRMIIEQLADPMIHIIRNAVDHGIETARERARKGKPEGAVLQLEAYHEGDNVIIEITDDGKGIDLERIRQKALEKNLADKETLARMSQQELIDLIMLPGFSTADQITHTSGRGVGMDVVKRSIEKINGSLDIETRQDVGTRLRIRIPLTLAIIPAMMIHSGGRHFTIPMSAVEETLRIDPGEIFTVDGSEVMHLDDEPLPLVRLAEIFNIQTAESSAGGREGQLFALVVNAAAGRTGLIVDSLLGRQEVVIKSIDDYLQDDSGVAGATILGDGSISLILNVDELVRMAKEREAERKLAATVF